MHRVFNYFADRKNIHISNKLTNQPLNDTLILETMKDKKYWIRLNTTIEHFNLPIDIWSTGDAAY